MVRRTEHQVSSELRRPLREVLYELYVEQGMTQTKMAELLRVDVSTVSRWLQKYGIPARRARWEFPDQECANL